MKKNYIPLQNAIEETNNKQKTPVQRRTFVEWCRKKYIRGVYFEDEINDYAVPKNFKLPYTTHGNPRGPGIYVSIVKGIIKGFDVCAELYGQGPSEFDAYMDELIEAGVVATFCDGETGITYYKQTLRSEEFSNLKRNKVLAYLSKLKINVNMGINISM